MESKDMTPSRSTSTPPVSCYMCGTLFENQDYLDNHTCNDSGEEEEDNCGWDEFLEDIKESFNEEFDSIVSEMVSNGLSQIAA